jgi:general secretion pathway protein M
MTRAMTLSPPVSRALALALLAIVLLLGFSFVVGPLIDEIGDARSAAARLHDAAERTETVERKLVVLKAELARLKEHQTSTVGFIAGANESIAAAELQNRIKTAVEAAKGELRSTQPLQGRDEGAFRRISIRGQIAVKLPALQRVLYDLESATPFLFLDNVEIRTQATYQINATDTDDPVLDVRFDLYGYMRKPG